MKAKANWEATISDEAFSGHTTLLWQIPVGEGCEPGSDGCFLLVLVEGEIARVESYLLDAAGDVEERGTTVHVHCDEVSVDALTAAWASAANFSARTLAAVSGEEEAPALTPEAFFNVLGLSDGSES